ncbi:MAG TPA: hypothetical protein VLC09_01195 [Polyangiaceae bacterium]|nr:hypothetical protein [Polyangiaceae bacterium]
MSEKKSGKPAHGFDGAGHMDAAHRERLLALSRQGRERDAAPFVIGSESDDALAEEFAEAAVGAMTSGEDRLGDDLLAVVDEERGGPFVETSGKVEFAPGTDESNIAEATREPFPTT